MSLPKRRSFSIRWLTVIGAAAVVGITVLSCIFSDIVDTPYVTYAFQVLSGNWGGSKPKDVDESSYIVGAIVAVILNTVTIAAIVKGAFELTLIRKDKSMSPKNAFNVRDQYALKNIMTRLAPITEAMDDREAKVMEDELWECFIAADKKWQTDFIPVVMPGKKGDDFLDSINSGPN